MQHANVVRTQVTPEEAISSVMERARQKYGTAFDWTRWRLRVVEFGQKGPPRTIHFRVDEARAGDAPRRVTEPAAPRRETSHQGGARDEVRTHHFRESEQTFRTVHSPRRQVGTLPDPHHALNRTEHGRRARGRRRRDIRDTLLELVQFTGRPVFAAQDGQEALDLLDRGAVPTPCLVLLDWIMSGMSGEEFLERLRTRAYAHDLRVVLVSGYSPAATGGWSPGVVGFLRKPFDIAVLDALLDEYT